MPLCILSRMRLFVPQGRSKVRAAVRGYSAGGVWRLPSASPGDQGLGQTQLLLPCMCAGKWPQPDSQRRLGDPAGAARSHGAL